RTAIYSVLNNRADVFCMPDRFVSNSEMPLYHIQRPERALWGIWHISEDEPTLSAQLEGETVPVDLTNPLKRLEFLAVRVLLKKLLEEWKLDYPGLRKDNFGKPFLRGMDLHI